MTFKVLIIVTKSIDKHKETGNLGAGVGISVSTQVIEFNTKIEAEAAIRRINYATDYTVESIKLWD